MLRPRAPEKWGRYYFRYFGFSVRLAFNTKATLCTVYMITQHLRHNAVAKCVHTVCHTMYAHEQPAAVHSSVHCLSVFCRKALICFSSQSWQLKDNFSNLSFVGVLRSEKNSRSYQVTNFRAYVCNVTVQWSWWSWAWDISAFCRKSLPHAPSISGRGLL